MARVPFYDIQAQYRELEAELHAAVGGVLAGGRYVMGPEHGAFEAEIAAYHDVRHAIGVANGTDALRILMDAVGVGAGDEVLTTAFTFVASAETIVQTGATPVFVDVDPVHFDLDPARVEEAITPRTKAILPIHLFGQLCDVRALREIADRRGLLLLEDAAQALGASHEGVAAGKFGLGGGVSFYVTKNLGAMGDAGMILTDHDDVAERCRSIRVHGMGRERYYYDHLGYTSRLDEVQAAFLRVKLRRLDAWTDRRREVAALYLEGLAGIEGLSLPGVRPGNVATWHQFSVRTPRRNELQAALAADGVDSMIYYPVPLHHHAPYARFTPPWSLEETERAAREILNLPIHPHLSDGDAERVIERVRALFVG